MYQFEKELYKKKINLIAGVDEVGRGPLAGPLVVACVILPKNTIIEGINDSKKLSEKKRNILFEEIISKAIDYAIVFVPRDVVDKINIYEATKRAMIKCVKNMKIKPDHVLIDAMKLELDIPSTSIIKGDTLSVSIAAASILAKVSRDKYMEIIDSVYPEYGFKSHKGYGTKKHLENLEKYGITTEHRLSYAPVKKLIK